VSANSLLDRSDERIALQRAIGLHSRVLVGGAPEAEVPAFADWVSSSFIKDTMLISWDFKRAAGIEGIDILSELAEKLPCSALFKEEHLAVKEEFYNTPQPLISQVVGEQAQAGNDQTFSAEINIPTLAEYIQRNLNRIAIAFFRDVEKASKDNHVTLLLSGICVGGEDPMPQPGLLQVFLSSIWRLAESCSPSELCVVLTATVASASKFEPPGCYFNRRLGLVGIDEAIEVLVSNIEGLTYAEAHSVVLSLVEPGSKGLSYKHLRERMTCLALNRLEPVYRDSKNA
jgi:hypothetical protein